MMPEGCSGKVLFWFIMTLVILGFAYLFADRFGCLH